MTREQVIKALKWFKEYNEEDYCGGDRIQDEHGDWYYRITEQDFEAFEMAIKALEQEPRWIPVSERKPEKGGEYLLWGKICEDEDDNYCFIGDYHEFDEAFGTEISNYDPQTLGFIDTEIEEYYSVVAWMPLPTDYSEVEKREYDN